MSLDERSWLGDSAAIVRKERMPHSAAAFAARARGARPFPVACAKILTLTSGLEFDAAQVATVLEGDPPLCARVLRVVNSAAFGLRMPCTSIRQATSLLGPKGVRSSVVAGAMLDLFPGTEDPQWAILHAHASRVAELSRHLAPEWRVPVDEMFLAAFLHDIGKWILLDLEPEYAAVLRALGSNTDATLDEERGRFGFDHAELGEHMLAAWNIPQPIPRVVGLHHDPAEAYGQHAQVAMRVALLRLADMLAHALSAKAPPDFAALAGSEPLTYLGISEQSLRERFAALKGLEPGGEAGTTSVAPHRAISEPPPRAPRAPEVCAYCDDASFGVTCGRCGARVCADHTPGRGRVCVSCETEFNARVQGSVLAGPGMTLTVAGAGITASAIVVGLIGAAWPALAPAVLATGLAVFGTWRRWQERAAFLAEKPGD